MIWSVVLGTTTTILVSWVVVLWVDPRVKEPLSLWNTVEPRPGDDRPELIALNERNHWGSQALFLMLGDPHHWPDEAQTSESIDSRIRWGRSYLCRPRDYSVSLEIRNAEARGWPWLALWCVPAEENVFSTGAVRPPMGGILIPEPFRVVDPRFEFLPTLPYIPIWPGFLADMLFWALLWYALIWCFHRVRSSRRLRQRRCPDCGYDLTYKVSDSCPECGYK